jgi:hypothetical protein
LTLFFDKGKNIIEEEEEEKKNLRFYLAAGDWNEVDVIAYSTLHLRYPTFSLLLFFFNFFKF